MRERPLAVPAPPSFPQTPESWNLFFYRASHPAPAATDHARAPVAINNNLCHGSVASQPPVSHHVEPIAYIDSGPNRAICEPPIFNSSIGRAGAVPLGNPVFPGRFRTCSDEIHFILSFFLTFLRTFPKLFSVRARLVPPHLVADQERRAPTALLVF